MNYIKEINSFYDWLETNPLSKSAIALWNALMHINNKADWKEKFTVATSVLEYKTGFKKSELFKARNELTQKNRISWNQRGGNLSAEYQIISFCFHNTEANGNANGNANGTQMVTQMVTINKLNKTKLNNVLLEKEPKGLSENFADDFSQGLELQENNELLNTELQKRKKVPQKKEKPEIPELETFIEFAKEIYQNELNSDFAPFKFSVQAKYESWRSANWKDGNGNEIKNWRTKLKNTIPHLKATYGKSITGNRTNGSDILPKQATYDIKEAAERLATDFANGNIPGVY